MLFSPHFELCQDKLFRGGLTVNSTHPLQGSLAATGKEYNVEDSIFVDIQVPSSASAFSHQPKVIIAPHTTENVKVSDRKRSMMWYHPAFQWITIFITNIL